MPKLPKNKKGFDHLNVLSNADNWFLISAHLYGLLRYLIMFFKKKCIKDKMYSSYQNWLGGSETLWQISGMLLCKRNPPHCLFGGHCYDN